MRRSLASLTLAAVLAVAIVTLTAHRKVPKQPEYVPDSDTAAAIAEAVLSPVYGKTHVESERPFSAMLKDSVWVVSGTVYCINGFPEAGKVPTGRGESEIVEISKKDAHIISMTHISGTMCK